MLFLFPFFLLYLLIQFCCSQIIFVDNTQLVNGDGTAGLPYNSLHSALLAVKDTGGTLALKPGTKYSDLTDVYTLTKNVNIASMGATSNISCVVVLTKISLGPSIELGMDSITFNRNINQAYDYMIEAAAGSKISLKNVAFSGITSDTSLKGIFKGTQVTFLSVSLKIDSINEYNPAKPSDSAASLTAFEDVFYFDTSDVTVSDASFSLIALAKGSVFNLKSTPIKLVYSKLGLMRLFSSTIDVGSLINSNSNVTIVNCTFFSILSDFQAMIVPKNYGVIFFDQLIVLGLSQASSSLNPLFFNMLVYQGAFYLNNSYFKSNVAVNEMIKITTLRLLAAFFKVQFISNLAKAIIYLKEISIVSATGVQFIDNNILPNNLPADGTCMNIRSVIQGQLLYCLFQNSMSWSTAAGLKFVDESDFDKFYPTKIDGEGFMVAYTNFTNNFVHYNDSSKEIGSAIYIDSKIPLKVAYCFFEGNKINMTKPVKDRIGGACVYSSNMFTNNRALYFSNCIQFLGRDIYVNDSTFSNNRALFNTKEEFASHSEGMGGALYLIPEKIYLLNSIFLYNRAYFAGCIYINMNNQKNTLQVLGANNTFAHNYADHTGGVMIFDADIMNADAKIANSTFKNNSADQYGGVLSTKYASLNASVYLVFSYFAGNNADFGGVFDLKHVIGYVYVIDCYLTQNYAVNDQQVASGGAMYLYGRSTAYVLLINSTFDRNTAQFRGGALFCLSGNVTHANMTYKNNFAFEGGSFYGTVYSLHFLKNATFMNETTLGYGGAVVVKEYSVLVLDQATFKGCRSGLRGGALMMIDETLLYVQNSKFLENFSKSGSALFSIEIMVRTITILSTVFINNTGADSVIGGMYTNLLMAYNMINNNSAKAISFTKKSNVTMMGVQILNHRCLGIEKGCIVSLSLNSIASLSNCYVLGISSKGQGGFAYLENSVLNILNTVMSNLNASKSACVMGIKYSQINMNNSFFQNYNPGCMYFSDSNVTIAFTSISNSLFVYDPTNKYVTGESVTEFSNCRNITLFKVDFKNNVNVSKEGAAVRIFSKERIPYQSTIAYCMFFNNTATEKAGALYIENQNFTLIMNGFMLNNAKAGGAIYLNNLDSAYVIVIMRSNSFINNFAEIEGGAIKYVEKPPFLNYSSKHFIGNYAPYGPNNASYPVSTMLFIYSYNQSDTFAKIRRNYSQEFNTLCENNIENAMVLENEESGKAFSKILEFNLMDQFCQVVTTINEGTASVTLMVQSNDTKAENQNQNQSQNQNQNQTQTIVGETSVPIKNGSFWFESLTLYAKPGSNWTLNFTNKLVSKFYSSFRNPDIYQKSYGGSYVFEMNIALRNCVRGEFYDANMNTCFRCQQGKYSLDPTKNECFECPENTNCMGGDQIIVKSGYWRSSENSTEIHKCRYNPDSCLGDYLSTCKTGHIGPLCASCDIFGDQKYTMSVGNECTECLEYGGNMAKIIFIGLALGILLCWIIYSSIAHSDMKDYVNFRSIYFKIFINYVQVTMLANGLEIDWPRIVQYILNIQTNIGSVTNFISLDCLIAETQASTPVLYVKAIMVILLPIFLLIFCGVFWGGMYHYTGKSKLSNFIASLIISVFFVHPTIINVLTGTVSCLEIDPGKFYISSNLYYECRTDEHNLWSYIMVYPFIVIWAIIFPLALFFYLKKFSTILDSPDSKKKLGFLYMGYKKDNFYWEFIIMLRKLLLIIVTSFWDSSVNVKALIVLLILAFSIYLQISRKPYRSSDLNELEFRSTLVSLLTIYLGLLYMVTEEIRYSALIFILIVLINGYFLLFWLVRMLVSYCDNPLFNYCPFFKQKFLKLKDEYQKLDNNRKSLFDFDEGEEKMKKGFSKQITKKKNQILSKGTTEDAKKINNYITVNLRSAAEKNREGEGYEESRETAKPINQNKKNDETSSEKSEKGGNFVHDVDTEYKKAEVGGSEPLPKNFSKKDLQLGGGRPSAGGLPNSSESYLK